MAQFINVAFSWLTGDSWQALSDHQFRVQSLLGLDPRYVSLSTWKDCDFPERYALVLHEAREEGEPPMIESIIHDPSFKELIEKEAGPPDVHVMRAKKLHGATLGSLKPGQLFSVSMRKAELGHEEVLFDELADIFDTIRYLDGYLGSALGPNAALTEEIMGIVMWRNREAFDESTPRGSFYEIRLFERMS